MTVLHQANAGQSAARNLGLEHATGEWVTFTDPDDMLAPGFLDAILRFVGRHPDVALVASMPVVVEERTGREHRHARHRQYAAGDRVVDLDREPSTFGGSSSVSFFRLDRVRAAGLRFDPRVRPNFEDGHFAVRYVLELAEPRIGVVPSARYLYRRRADGTSSCSAATATRAATPSCSSTATWTSSRAPRRVMPGCPRGSSRCSCTS